MSLFRQLERYRAEELIFCRDQASGLRAIICISSTVLGPAVGGTRMRPYPTEADAVEDVLRLAQGMTYKSAGAGLDYGGGKAVIIGDPAKDKSEALLRAYGHYVQSLGGRFITAADLGTNIDDLVMIRRETQYVTALPSSMGGSGDSAIPTALGVFMGMRACAKDVWGTESLAGRRIIVQGAGKVGWQLMGHLAAENADLYVSDMDEARAREACIRFGAKLLPAESANSTECDIFSPNATGAVLNDDSIRQLRCRVVAGAANNQLAERRHGQMLHDRGIVYAPDFIINAGGLINIAEEMVGYDQERALKRVERIFDTMQQIIAISKEKGMPTAYVAEALAEERLKKGPSPNSEAATVSGKRG